MASDPNSKGKTDRWIVVVGALILIAAVGLLTFDDWIWGGRRSGGDVIGKIESRDGDVRVKYAGDVKWQKANQGDALVYNDTIFSGAKSQVGLSLGKSSINLGENSLVVIRKQNDAQFLALSYGTMTGKVHAGDQIMIDTGEGKPVLLNAKSDSEISLRKINGKPELNLIKGNAELNHKALSAGRPEQLNATAVKPPPPPPPPPPRLAPKQEAVQAIKIIKPKAAEKIYSKDELAADFQWTYGDKTQVDPKTRFSIEFSKTSEFTLLKANRTIDGKTSDVVRARNSIDLYYRVRGPKNELSEVEKFSFIRMQPPVIVSPLADAKYSSTSKTPASVAVQFQPAAENPLYWMQISSDEDFKTVLVNESHPEVRTLQALPSGVYYLRARTDYGQEHLSDWSRPVHFMVRDQAPRVAPRWAFQNYVLIPNKAYPDTMYSASPKEVESYLAEQGFLADYFAPVKGMADQVVLDFMDNSKPKANGFAWPTDHMEPSPRPYMYRYQVQKRGRLPSRWSQPEKLTIALAPPRGTRVDPHAGNLTKDGRVPVKVEWTPLLFASQYEVQLAQNEQFLNPKALKVTKPGIGFYAQRNRVYYWRARALNAKGEPISDFSSNAKMNSGDFEPAILQAQAAKKDADKKRQPASEEALNTSSMKLSNSVGARTFENPGFWMWAGTGANFVDYNQSIPGRGTFDSKSIKMMSEYLEFGWAGDGHMGAVMTYKNTPGQLISNVPVTNANYNWQTLSAEGIYCPVKETAVWGMPLLTGIRFGVQYQEMPFYFLNFDRTLVSGNADMLEASIGGMAEMSVNRWRYYWNFRYQYPLSSAAPNSSSFDPKFAFDGSVGAAYYLTHNIKTGLFWYGQWQQFGFSSSDGTVTNSGTQMLFYSAFDLRLGYDF